MPVGENYWRGVHSQTWLREEAGWTLLVVPQINRFGSVELKLPKLVTRLLSMKKLRVA